jgi:GNAT superfamily N-acetyltransferase
VADLKIKSLTPALLPDFLAFFDHEAFADNPEWAGCFCVYYHVARDDWLALPMPESADKQVVRERKHRDLACGLIAANAMSGFLAYAGDRVVGWCNAGRREAYQNAHEYAQARDATGNVGAVMCFVVAATHRRRGVASALLEAACDALRADGLEYAEAYPSLNPEGPNREAAIYHGTIDMYAKAGFERVRDLEDFAVMRRRLTE